MRVVGDLMLAERALVTCVLLILLVLCMCHSQLSRIPATFGRPEDTWKATLHDFRIRTMFVVGAPDLHGTFLRILRRHVGIETIRLGNHV
jgi:hypothetical protein